MEMANPVNSLQFRFLPTDSQSVEKKEYWKREEKLWAVYLPSDNPCFHKVICQGFIIYPNGKLKHCEAFLLEVSTYSFGGKGKARIKCRKCKKIIEIEKPLSMNIRRTRLYRHSEYSKLDYDSWYEVRCPTIISRNGRPQECNNLLFKVLAADDHSIGGMRSEIKCHQCDALVKFTW
jgi:phage FluMu protein Com